MKKNKGFTLIELLVVIAIIGILSSVVLASLNTARDKGNDAAVKTNLTTVRTQAELYYDDNSNTYEGMCDVSPITDAIEAAGTAGNGSQDCYDDSNEWMAFAKLKTSNTLWFCADYQGVSTTTTTDFSAAQPADGSIKCN